MKIAIYTSFAVNYLAKARVLVESTKACNPDIDVFGLVSDRFPIGFDLSQERFAEIWMVEDYPADPLKGWIYRHNIMELSTAVKGWALNRLLDMGYDYVMYLDPDCWVLEDPARIIDLLPAGCSVGVVPHTTAEADSDEEIRIVETSSLRHGIYNLGFLIVRNDENGRRLAKWWASRLDQYCVDDFSQGLFTDQRWFDLAAGYFDFIKIIRHHGIDVASWNIGQRTLARNGDGYLIDGDGLVFYHFSGVGPTGVHRWVRDKFAPADPLAAELEFRYEKLIGEAGQAELEKIAPYFDTYSDGAKIPLAHRHLYRKDPEFLKRFPDPFDVSVSPSFRSIAESQTGTAVASAPRNDLGDLDALARRLFDGDYFARRTSTQGSPSALWKEYRKAGWKGRVQPNRFFNTAYYRMFVSEADTTKYPTPLHHYIAEGVEARLSPCWIYDDNYYLAAYPDIRDGIRAGYFSCGFEHFALHGAKEGRNGCSYFNERGYLESNPDVAAAVLDGALRSGEAHFVSDGNREGRLPR
jgi:hypothetical protein